MEKKSYSELLKDPRWQKKRLEILNRDKFECRCCGRDDKTLQVHHIIYETGRKPWEYNNDDLITLCEFCHETWGLLDKSGHGWDMICSIARLFNEWEVKSLKRSGVI